MKDVRLLLAIGETFLGHTKLSKAKSGIRKPRNFSGEDIRALAWRLRAKQGQ